MDGKEIFFSVSQLKIKTAQFLLSEAGIASHVINKLDSAHAGLFGDIELYVDASNEEEARRILDEGGIL